MTPDSVTIPLYGMRKETFNLERKEIEEGNRDPYNFSEDLIPSETMSIHGQDYQLPGGRAHLNCSLSNVFM